MKFDRNIKTNTIHSRKSIGSKAAHKRSRLQTTLAGGMDQNLAKMRLKAKIIEGTAIISFAHSVTLDPRAFRETGKEAERDGEERIYGKYCERKHERQDERENERQYECGEARKYVGVGKWVSNRGVGEGKKGRGKVYRPWSPYCSENENAGEQELNHFLLTHH